MTTIQALSQGGIQTAEDALAWCQTNRAIAIFETYPPGWIGYPSGGSVVMISFPWGGVHPRASGSTLVEAVNSFIEGYRLGLAS